MAVPAMPEYGRDPYASGQAARGTKSRRVTINFGALRGLYAGNPQLRISCR